MQYTTLIIILYCGQMLFYQDFKDTFVCNTQHARMAILDEKSCFIRISKILLYAIHNHSNLLSLIKGLFYQDFNEQFEGYTQRILPSPITNQVVLSGCQ